MLSADNNEATHIYLVDPILGIISGTMTEKDFREIRRKLVALVMLGSGGISRPCSTKLEAIDIDLKC